MKRRFLSSVNRPIKYVYKRYEKDMDNRTKRIRLSKRSFSKKILQKYKMKQTSGYELCKLEHFDYKVPRPIYYVFFNY